MVYLQSRHEDRNANGSCLEAVLAEVLEGCTFICSGISRGVFRRIVRSLRVYQPEATVVASDVFSLSESDGKDGKAERVRCDGRDSVMDYRPSRNMVL